MVERKRYNSDPCKVPRRSKPKITVEDAIQNPNHSAKSKQAWRYSGGSIDRAASTTLNGTFYEDPKDPGLPRRKQESNFFLTINTNRSTGDVHALERTLTALSADAVLMQYLRYGPVDACYTSDQYNDVVEDVKWTGSVERGDKLGNVHGHVWLTIVHYSQIQINTRALMTEAKQLYNSFVTNRDDCLSKQPYVHIRLLPQSNFTDVIRAYIHKGMATTSTR